MTEHVMYIAAIKLPPGKLAAQVGHGVLGLYKRITRKILNEDRVDLKMSLSAWEEKDPRGDRGITAKVVLKLQNDDELQKVMNYCLKHNIEWYIVKDAGRTIVEPGTLTCVAWGPVPKDMEGPWMEMKLY